MTILATDAVPKGNTGMTLLASNNDDGNIKLPNIGFDFMYAGTNIRNAIYVGGNCWVGLNGSNARIGINGRDTKAVSIYGVAETVDGHSTYRVRWEGWSTYNKGGVNDIIWEMTFFDDGTIQLICASTPEASNNVNRFYNPYSGGWLNFTWANGYSYVYKPTESNPNNYTLQRGSYVQFVPKFLIEDGSYGIKYWNSDISEWLYAADGPATVEMFNTYGTIEISASRIGLFDSKPKLLYYKNDTSPTTKTVKEIFAPSKRVIKQNTDIEVPAIIDRFGIYAEISSGAKILIAFSIDSGETWKSYHGGSWIAIDIEDLNDFEDKGMIPSTVNGLSASQVHALGYFEKIRVAHLFSQSAVSDICKINNEYFFHNKDLIKADTKRIVGGE